MNRIIKNLAMAGTNFSKPGLEKLQRWHIGRRLRRHLQNWREVRDAYFAQSQIPPLAFHNGLRMHHGAGDAPVFLLLEIFDDAAYQPRDKRPLHCVLDLGANIGYFCAWVSLHYPEASVIAFEPAGASWKKLEANVERNGIKRVTIRNEAAAGTTGTAEFLESETSVISSLSDVSLPSQREAVRQVVHTRSLADCIQLSGHDRVDLCKMDVEGAEVDVLRGAAEDTLRQVSEFIIEVHDDRIPNALKTCTERLSLAGFQCRSHWLDKGQLSMLRAWKRP